MNDLAPGESPGMFMVGELGVAIGKHSCSVSQILQVIICLSIEQDGLVTSAFSGLRFHGGFPPTAPKDTAPEPWSYRFVIVCYPPRHILNSSARFGFGALPDGNLFTMWREMMDPTYECSVCLLLM